jgi:hypothetical protein
MVRLDLKGWQFDLLCIHDMNFLAGGWFFLASELPVILGCPHGYGARLHVPLRLLG